MFLTIITFILVLGLLVFAHELGHFISAKKMGMKVDEFGFGYPPRIWGWRHPKSGTIYSINWIPVGGFVRIKGESGEFKHDRDSFSAKAAWRRFIVLVAGVVMNIVLAAGLLSIGFMIGLPSAIDENTPPSAIVKEEQLIIMRVMDGSPAAEAKVTAGDALVSIDGKIFETSEAAREYIGERAAAGIDLTLQKESGDYYDARIMSRFIPEADMVGIGVGIVKTGIVSYPPHIAVGQGISATWLLTGEITKAFGGIIHGLLTTGQAGVDISGPVGIAVMSGEFAQMGFVYLLQFMAILSINLAIINILPLPALDGGRILFLIIEKIRRRPVSEKVEGVIHTIGFALLMLIVVVVTYQDFARYGGRMWEGIKGLFGA
ncbi:RIP metalloprotease RseP [Patescibacteria group bacterium]|nr:RIP metalloprotease RseP [Patescibacteria group bacterium]MBU1705713.1 RIP metalloprotease RseP [Patescibacteria group bacterium]